MKIDSLKFYRNETKNNNGVTLEGVWNYDGDQLEQNHNYIQWLFPIDEKSKWNWSAPVLTKYDIEILRNDETVVSNFRKSLEIFFSFLGFSLHGDVVGIADDFEKKSKNWLTLNNHNYKRISRILKFLTLFGFAEIKKGLVNALNGLYQEYSDVIGEKTYNIWMRM